MSRTWPKVMGFLALAVALWWALSLLQSNTDGLASLTYQQWGRDLASHDAFSAGGAEPFGAVTIDGAIAFLQTSDDSIGNFVAPFLDLSS